MIAEYIARIQENPAWIGYGLLACFLLLLAVIALLVWRRAGQLTDSRLHSEQLRERLELLVGEGDELKQNLAETVDLLNQHKTEVAVLSSSIENQRQTEAAIKTQFTVLANEVMRTQSADFKKANAEQLSYVLGPLKQNIESFEKELRGVHEAAGKDRVLLKAEILSLTTQSQQVREEAHNLTQALKGDSQKQGAWGEMILASILDRSGLREGEEYETQEHHRDDEGRALRPDIVVNLPGGRRLVVDSKVSLVAYERAMNAKNDAAREVDLKAHVASVKNHIDTLSKKNYHQLDDGSVDYVIMFMPIESAFSEAVRADKNLTLYATERDVLIASPTNLMLALKTVENLWSVENRNKNAMKIAKRAGRLYDKFADFVSDMEKIGTQLTTAQKTHDTAMARLATGRGNLVSQAETLKKLGARASKQIELEHDEEDLGEASLPTPSTPS